MFQTRTVKLINVNTFKYFNLLSKHLCMLLSGNHQGDGQEAAPQRGWTVEKIAAIYMGKNVWDNDLLVHWRNG